MDKEKSTTARRGRHGQFSTGIGGCRRRPANCRPPPRPAVPPSFVFERPQRRRQRWTSCFARARRGGGSGRFLDFATHGNGFEYFFNRFMRLEGETTRARASLAGLAGLAGLDGLDGLDGLAGLACSPPARLAAPLHLPLPLPLRASRRETHSPSSRMRWTAAPPPSFTTRTVCGGGGDGGRFVSCVI